MRLSFTFWGIHQVEQGRRRIHQCEVDHRGPSICLWVVMHRRGEVSELFSTHLTFECASSGCHVFCHGKPANQAEFIGYVAVVIGGCLDRRQPGEENFWVGDCG